VKKGIREEGNKKEMAATFCAEPEAIFLPKFENANAKARELYASLGTAARSEPHRDGHKC